MIIETSAVQKYFVRLVRVRQKGVNPIFVKSSDDLGKIPTTPAANTGCVVAFLGNDLKLIGLVEVPNDQQILRALMHGAQHISARAESCCSCAKIACPKLLPQNGTSSQSVWSW